MSAIDEHSKRLNLGSSIGQFLRSLQHALEWFYLPREIVTKLSDSITLSESRAGKNKAGLRISNFEIRVSESRKPSTCKSLISTNHHKTTATAKRRGTER